MIWHFNCCSGLMIYFGKKISLKAFNDKTETTDLVIYFKEQTKKKSLMFSAINGLLLQADHTVWLVLTPRLPVLQSRIHPHRLNFFATPISLHYPTLSMSPFAYLQLMQPLLKFLKFTFFMKLFGSCNNLVMNSNSLVYLR